MVVRRKPASVDEFIQDGGSVPQVVAPQPMADLSHEEAVKGLKLRLPVDLLNRVDEAVKLRHPAPSRHQWILEAIYEKLDRQLADQE
jgi:uncharacterized protein YfaA (DUF2138 family)